MTSQSPMDDQDAIARVLAGNAVAFEHIVLAYHRRLYYCVAGKLPASDEAEDIVQKTFVTAFRNLSQFRGDQPLYPWLRKIALNHCRNEWRSIERRARLQGRLIEAKRADLQAGRLDESDEVDDLQERRAAALRACLQSLDETESRTLRLRFIEELSLDEISREFGKTCEATRLFLFRLRQRLSRCVAKRLSIEGGSS